MKLKATKATSSFLLGAFIAAVALLMAGCSSYGPKFDPYAKNQPDSKLGSAKFTEMKLGTKPPGSWLQPPKESYRLGPGDELLIEIVGVAASQSTTFVTPDGKLYYQNVAGAKVKGLTVPELKDLLERELAAWYHAPQVSVALNQVKSQRVWIMGRVNEPGIYPLSRPITIIEALSLAGGLETAPVEQTSTRRTAPDTQTAPMEVADLSRAFIVREGKMLPVDFEALINGGDMAYNIYLQNGDYVYFPAAAGNEIFVMGAVNLPRSVRYTGDMNLISAIAQAGGTTQYAHVQHVVIIRGSLNNPKVAVVPYKDVATGEARNVSLMPHDIVWVPRSPWERLDTQVRNFLTTFVRSVAVNEGAKFADPQATAVGTTINVGGADIGP